MTDTTMQLLSQGTDPVKMPDFDILAEGKTLSGVAERLMSLSLTDNRGFEADQLQKKALTLLMKSHTKDRRTG